MAAAREGESGLSEATTTNVIHGDKVVHGLEADGVGLMVGTETSHVARKLRRLTGAAGGISEARASTRIQPGTGNVPVAASSKEQL
jgi:hypothetical protein